MLCDFHFHTSFSGDCETPPVRQLERAVLLGMERVCVTDHHDCGVESDVDFTLDFPAYFRAMTRLREDFGDRIRLETGVELGLQRRVAGELEELVRTFDFDFIVGSCHFVDGQDLYYPSFYEGRTDREALERFFLVSLERVRVMDCFDSFGHLDYAVRYCRAKNRDYRASDYLEYIEPLLRTLIEKGKALECNTGGFRCGLGHPNPCEDILRLYRQLGGELLTVGSDAHDPAGLGFAFDRTAGLLRACGFRYYTVYHRRRPEFLPL